MRDKRVVVESSSWQNIDVFAVANYDDSIEVGEREYSESSKCYVKKVKLSLTGESADELYELMRHIRGECDDYDCPYCEETEEEDESWKCECCELDECNGGCDK